MYCQYNLATDALILFVEKNCHEEFSPGIGLIFVVDQCAKSHCTFIVRKSETFVIRDQFRQSPRTVIAQLLFYHIEPKLEPLNMLKRLLNLACTSGLKKSFIKWKNSHATCQNMLSITTGIHSLQKYHREIKPKLHCSSHQDLHIAYWHP